MKKKLIRGISLDREKVRKIWMTMRLIVILFFVSLIHVSASVYSQKTKLNIRVENATLQQVFNVLQEQSEFDFFYKNEQIPADARVSIQYQNESIEVILDKILSGTGLTYHVLDKDIVISAKGASKSEMVAQQQKSVSGKVTDSSKASLPGVSVVVKGTTIGTISDADGNYSLSNVPENATLQFSFVGMKGQEIAVGNKTSVNVTMEEETLGIEEVVAIGYGTSKKSDLTGSVYQVSSDVIRTQSVTKDPIQILQGKVPGLDITTGNKPGDVSTPIIRGYNSINASNAPLIVLDGAPFGGRLSDINPSEIENIDVLKDASSTAIYGSRGANGVIIITTKRAKMDGKISFAYDGYAGISKSFKNFNMMTGEKWADYRRTANPGQTDAELFDAIQLDIIQNKQFTNWQKLMFDGTGMETDHSFSLSASKDNMSNIIVLGYNKNQSILDNMSYERFSARINGDIKISNNISTGYSSMLSHSLRDLGENSVFAQGTLLNPVTRAYDEDGKKLFYPSTFAEAYQQTNPLFDIDEDNLQNQSFRDRLFLNLYLDLEFFTGLKFRSSLTTDWQFLEDGNYYNPSTSARLLSTNSASFSKASEKSITFTNILSYKKSVKEHRFDLSLVHDMQKYTSDRLGLMGQDIPYYGKWYNVNEAPDIFSRSASFSEWALLSFMGRFNYSFKERYLLTFTGRSDGSSRLAKGKKWDFFPSAAFAWRINSEPFMESVSTISNLKLRFSWGNTGNTAINPYATQGALGKYTYVLGTNEDAAIGYLPTELPNTNLGWERTEEINIGLDFGLFKNKLNGSVDIYQRNTHDLLMKRSLPITSGYDDTWQNIGKTRNEGIEIALNAVAVSKKDFVWDINVSFAYNRNEIRELYNGKVDDPGNKWFIGQPLYVERLYDFDGIWQLGQEAEAAVYGRKPGDVRVLDKNDSKTYDQADLTLHNKVPKFTGGLSSSLKYKKFDFNLYAYTRQDYGEVIGILTTEAGSSRYNHIDVDFWTPNNPSNTFPKPVNSNSQPLLIQSNYAFRDLSFIRLKNINLGYTFSKRELQEIKAEKLRVYLAVDNPFVWSMHKFEGLDPENTKSYYDHRPLTTFLVGINVNF